MLFGVVGQGGESATHWDSLSRCASSVGMWPATVRGAKVLKRRVCWVGKPRGEAGGGFVSSLLFPDDAVLLVSSRYDLQLVLGWPLWFGSQWLPQVEVSSQEESRTGALTQTHDKSENGAVRVRGQFSCQQVFWNQ